MTFLLFLINLIKYSAKSVCTNHIIFTMIFITSTALFAQKGTISGSINFKDGTPATMVSVFIENTSIHAYTNKDGLFQLPETNFGKHKVSIKYFGKESEIVEVNLIKDHINFTHGLKFNETDQLDEVTVTAKTKEDEIESRGYAVNAIKMQDVQVQSIQTTDVLDRTSGVRIRQTGGLGSRTNYNINGLSGNAIRVFINGSPIQSFGPSFSLSSIPTNLIERIEVYKGVVPISLAGDALGGAINVILKKGFESNALNTSYSFGSFNTHQVSLSGNFYNAKNGFTVKGSGFYNYSDNNYEVWGNQVYTTEPTTGDITYLTATRFHDSYNSAGLKTDIGISNRKWADELLLGVVYSKLDKDIQHGATMETVYGNRNAEQNTKLASLSYNDLSFLNNEKLNVELFSSYSKLNRQITDTIPHMFDWDGKRKEKYDDDNNFIGYYEHITGAEAGNPTLQESVEDVYIGRLSSGYDILENHRISTNFLYSRFTRSSEDPLRHIDIRDLEDTRYSNKNILGIGYDFHTLDNNLKISTFYKYFNQNIQIIEYKKQSDDAPIELNNVDRTVTADGFGLTIAYKITPTILIQTSAENSFRLPVARELFGNVAENLEPNYDLKPERSKNLNLGANFGPFNFNKNQFTFKVNTFIRDTEDKIKRNVREDNTDETTEYVNDDSYFSTGFDIDIMYSYDRKLDFNGNVSIFNSRFNTQFDDTGLEYNWYQDRERNAPFFTANGNLRYNIPDIFKKGSLTNFYTNLSYVHWFYRDWESLGGTGKDIIPTQLVSDIGVAHTFPSKTLTLSFDARNIFNHQVFDNYALQKPGRAFYMKINYTIF